MKDKKLIVRFQNPNTAETTVDFFLRVMMSANEKRMEELLLHTIREQQNREESHDAGCCLLPCFHG